MFVKEDFKHLKTTANNKLQLFPVNALNTTKLTQNAHRPELGYLACLKIAIHEFAAYSSMHGMNRIFENKSSKFKRIIWIAGFLLCLMILMYVSYRVAWYYRTKPLVTVVSFTHHPIFRIPFPEVTICNKNRFNWQRFEMAKRVFLKPEHQMIPKYQEIFLQVVNAYDTLSVGRFYKFKNLTAIPHQVLRELHYISFRLVAEFMAWKCYEIFSDCKWLDDPYNCCDIFFMRNSELGSCLAFNTMESIYGVDKHRIDSFWPWRAKDSGIFNGLAVKINLLERYHSPLQNNKNGILVMLTEPSVWFSSPIEIDTHTRTSISLDAVLYTYSNYTRIISPKVRKCLFEEEVHNNYYKSLPNRPFMYENCRSQCHLEFSVKFCNCTLTAFYPQTSYRACKVSDYPCLVYYNDQFNEIQQSGENDVAFAQHSSGAKCTCFHNCNSLNYRTTVTTAYMTNRKMDFNNSFISLNIFFQKNFITVFLTTVSSTLSDLMASFGGLAGLCIGCSLLSLVEIAYFLVIKLPHTTLLHFEMRKQLKWRRKSRAVKEHVMDGFLSN